MNLRLLMYCRGQFLDNEAIKKWLGMFIVASKKLDFPPIWCFASYSGSPIDEWTLWSFDFWSNGKNNGHRKKYEAERTGSCLKASQRKRRKKWNRSHSTTTNENNWFGFLLVCVWNQKSGDRWKSGQRWFDCLSLSLALPLSLWLSLCYQLFLTVVSSWLIFWIVIWSSLGKKKIVVETSSLIQRSF